MHMKITNTSFCSFAFILGLATGQAQTPAPGQDVIYMVDEMAMKCVITEITGKKVKYTNESGQVRTTDVEEVLMVFNEAGSFVLAPLAKVPDAVAGEFIKAPVKATADLIVTLDANVIPAFFTSVDANEVRYHDAQGPDAEKSMGKDQIAVLISRGGGHELLVSPSQSAEILAKAKRKIDAVMQQPFSLKPAVSGGPAASVGDTVTEDTVTATALSAPAPSDPAGVAAPVEPAEGSAGNRETPASAAGTAPAESVAGTAPTEPAPPPPADAKAEISKEEFEGLKIKALQKVNDFTDYLKIITDLNSDRDKIKTATDLAVALFADDNARIEVSNVNTGLKNKYKVKEYLNRLSYRTNQYDKINVEYANINYAKDFVQRPDGKYYGEIEFVQTFRGYVNGKAVYGDVTRRKAVVIQQQYDKAEEGGSRKLWDVFLSDIGVIETKKF